MYYNSILIFQKAYPEQVGGCIWIMLYLGDGKPQKPIYLVIHTALSLVFLYNQKSAGNKNLPIIEKVLFSVVFQYQKQAQLMYLVFFTPFFFQGCEEKFERLRYGTAEGHF